MAFSVDAQTNIISHSIKIKYTQSQPTLIENCTHKTDVS
jgi:hypothetical protein